MEILLKKCSLQIPGAETTFSKVLSQIPPYLILNIAHLCHILRKSLSYIQVDFVALLMFNKQKTFRIIKISVLSFKPIFQNVEES